MSAGAASIGPMNPMHRLRRTRWRWTAPAALVLSASLTPLALSAAVPAAPPSSAPTAPAAPAPPPAPLPAGTALYDVEIVVFRSVGAAPLEDWTAAPSPRGFGSPNAQPGLAPQVVRVLGPNDYRLDGIVDGLRRSGVWRPIAHAAWLQNAPNWGSHIGLPLSAVGVDVPGLTGLVFLERAPLYLHLGFDVTLLDGDSFRIDEMHNVRQNEKEYFDHPAFGIIAVVTALKGPSR
jgi:hypothetical protein